MGLRSPLVGLSIRTACLCLFISATAASAGTVSFTWSTDDARLTATGDGYVSVGIDGGWNSSSPGTPDLPWIPLTVELDRGEVIESWAFEPTGWRALGTEVRVVPAIDEAILSLEGKADPIEDPAFYGSDLDYPGDAVRYLGIQAGAGEITASFLVTPFRWNPQSQVLEMATGGMLRYDTGVADTDRFLPNRVRPAALPTTRSLPAIQGATLSRGTQGGTSLHALSRLGETEGPSVEGTPVEFLLLTTDEFAPVFEDLVDWKNRSGVPAATRTVEWIYEHYPHGIDRQEKIRLFLRDAYLYWGTRTVLIGGDPSRVPGRYAQDYSWNGANGGTSIVTDHYYACLDGNWNANGNSLYGEPPIGSYGIQTDMTDLRPELRVGRISCVNLAEAQIYMEKYRAYAMEPPQDPYLRDVLVLGEVLFEKDWRVGDCDDCDTCPSDDIPCASDDGAGDAIDFIEQLEQHSAGDAFEFAELYERDYWWAGLGRPNARPLRLTNVLEEINGGVNIIFHSGHGDRDRWAIGPDRVEAGTLRSLVNASEGPGYVGLVYSINCNSAAIDYDCAAEAFHFAPNGGGLIYIGSTNLDFPNSARTMQELTFSKWPGDGLVTPGDAFFFTADSVAKTVSEIRSPNRFVLYSLAFLGDPDMTVWTDIPQTLTVGFDDEISLGGGSTTVVVQLDGQPLADARVGLYKAGDALASGLTGSDGAIDLDFLPETVGEFSVTVTHPRGLPYTGAGEVVVGGNPFVALTGYTIDDTTNEAAGILGNGNGVFDVGETVAFDLEFGNTGTGGVSALQASLRVDDTVTGLDVEIDVLEASVSLGALAEGATGSQDNAFLVSARSLTEGAKEEQALPLEIVWSQDGSPRIEKLFPKVYRPNLVMYTLEINETDGDGDGIPEAGEVFLLTVDFLNIGLGTPYGYEVRLVANPGRASIDPLNMPLVPAGPLQHVRTESEIYIQYFWQHNTFEILLEVWDVSDPDSERMLVQRVFDMVKPEPPSEVLSQGFQDRIALGWRPSVSDDSYAFRVYRSTTPEGPYAPTGVGLVPRTSAAADSAYYSDDDLPALTSFYYKVAVVDSSGNESALTEPIEATTTPGFMPGWPVTLQNFNAGAPVVEQLGGGGYEVILGTDVIYAFTEYGGDFYDGDNSESTRGVLSDEQDGYRFGGKPAVYDIDEDGKKEIIAVSQHRARLDTDRELEVTCFDHLGNVQWSRSVGNAISLGAPAVGDIDGDGDMEIVLLTGRSLWAFHHDGRPFANSGAIRTFPSEEAFFLYGGVSLAEVYDGPEVGALEIIFVTRPPTTNGGQLHVIRAAGGAEDIPNFPLVFADYGAAWDHSNSSPAVVDLDPSEDPDFGEIIVTTRRDVWAVDPEGSAEPVIWNRQIEIYPTVEVNPSPAVGDIDRDNVPEVVVPGGRGYLYVLDARTGEPKPEFMTGTDPWLETGADDLGSPIIGDVTGDENPEILVGSDDGIVYAYDHNGNNVRGFPFVNGGQIRGGLALWDLDKNGTTELVIQSDQILQITVIEFPDAVFDHESPNLLRYPWMQFRHDTRNTGNTMSYPITPLALQAPLLEQVGDRTVRLRWIAEEGFGQFQLHRKDLRYEDWELVGSWRAQELRAEDGFYELEDVVPEFASYSYRLVGVEPDGFEVQTPEQSIEVSAAGLEFALGSARPNPSGRITTLELSLPKASPGRVVVVDPSGRIVRTLAEGTIEAGIQEFSWDGSDDGGRRIGAGVFFVRAEVDALGSRSTKLIRLR